MAESNNKRVAKNTLFLYFRMMLIMLVTLYTSRVVLDELGILDYGVYNVVGGVVTMFSFLNSCMSSATQRFLTFELGKNNHERLKDVFAASLNIHIAIAIAIVILTETIGLWFVNTKLVIEPERMIAANWVYQFSILTFCVNIIQVPYNAVLIAHEKMGIYAYISILEVFLKLGIVYMLVILPVDKLVIYAILVFCIQLLIRAIYQHYCHKHYKESNFRMFWDKDLYKQMSSFAGWNLFGSVAWLLRNQGVNIVLNMFFGPVINAARGIAFQVSNAVMGFISNFQVALNPQITKNYAAENIEDMEKLSYLGIKFSYFILFVMALPLCLNIDYILHIWLVEVPDYTSLFIILILIDSLVGNLFGVPLMTSLSATGNIRNYQIVVSCIILCIIPFGYIVLKLGYGASSIFYISIIFTLISGIARFMYCRKLIGYSWNKLMSKALFPIIGVTIVAWPLSQYLKILFFDEQTFTNFVLLCFCSVIITLIVSWTIGLARNERYMLISVIKKKLHKQ